MALRKRKIEWYERRCPRFRNVIESIARPTDLTALQLAAIEHRGGNVALEGGPGAGKTRVIVERCRSLFATGVSSTALLVLTSQRSADELRARFHQFEGSASPMIRTFHAFAAWIIEQGGSTAGRRLLAEPAERALFRHAAESVSLTSLPPGIAQSAFFLNLAKAHVDELRRAPADARRILAARGTPRTRDLIELAANRELLRERLDLAGGTDLVARVVELAGRPGPNPIRRLLQRFEHILIDEFQDADPVQLSLLQYFDGDIFAAGNVDQAIYGFRQNARAALAKTRAERSMTTMRLGPSFRCPPDVLALAHRAQPPVLPGAIANDGTISFRRAMSPRDEAALIGQWVEQAAAAGTPVHTIAILLRDTQPMTRLLERDLRARGIAIAERGGSEVLDDPVVDVICAVFKAFAAPTQIVLWVELLSHPALAIPPLGLRLAAAVTPPQSLEAVCLLLEGLDDGKHVRGAQIADALRAAHGHWQLDDLANAARSFAARADLSRCVSEADTGSADVALQHFSCLNTFYGALADVCDVRARMKCDASAAANFAALLESSCSLRIAAAPGADNSGVHIMSVHAAKGREFAFVVIADAVDGRFPKAWRADGLLGSVDVDTARACGVDIGMLPDEHLVAECALWSVAVTRTKRQLLITWSEMGLDGSPQRAGRFIPLDARLQEARRPSFRAPLEDAKFDMRDVQGATPARLSRPIAVSTFDTWLTCRRKFYYTALLQIGGSQRGFKAKLGTLVHRAIQDFHSVVRDFHAVETGAHAVWSGQLRSAVAAILRSADPPFEPFASALETSAAIRAAHRLVGRYARELERTARETHGFAVIASEKRVNFSLSGVAFTGKIDRIDAYADESLGMVDIKTGAFAKNKEMADGFVKLGAAAESASLWTKPPSRVSPQLALYRHAVAAETLAFVYLDAPSKADEHADAAHTDRLSCLEGQPALAAVDAVIATAFVEPWTAGVISSLDPTRFARSCRSCEFNAVCPGYLEDDEP